MEVNKEYRKIKVKKLSPEKVLAHIKNNKILIIDVRPQNFKKSNSFIHGAVHIPLLNFMAKLPEINIEKNIILTDWAMKQAPTAAKYLSKHGYKVIGVLKGGIERWTVEKRPVEKRPVEKK
jgi:rhodanese-related sulfurtransferase